MPPDMYVSKLLAGIGQIGYGDWATIFKTRFFREYSAGGNLLKAFCQNCPFHAGLSRVAQSRIWRKKIALYLAPDTQDKKTDIQDTNPENASREFFHG